MPDITFILPHWIYWGGILAVPLLFMAAARRLPSRAAADGVSLPLAYLLWAISGFMGLHRLYLRSWAAAAFIALFVGIILCNYEAKLTRNAHSIARNDAFNASYDLERAGEEGAEEDALAALREDLEAKSAREADLAARLEAWHLAAGAIALVVLALLVVDGFLMPGNVRRARERERSRRGAGPPPGVDDPVSPHAAGLGAFSRAVSRANATVGEFAAYWTVIAVFVFYYEVVARYIFNSPTIWAHESMFLLFGMQYLLAGGFCLREGAHVRVDVFYTHLGPRGRAIADLATSVFFLIFVCALLVTGWIFFRDSFAIGQVSHTEWEIPHWPIKMALPLGGALLLLQGVVHLLRDVATLRAAAD